MAHTLSAMEGGFSLSRVFKRWHFRRKFRAGLVFLVGIGLGAALTGPPTAWAASFSELVDRADAAFCERFVESRMRESLACYQMALDLEPLPVQSEAVVLSRLSQLCYELTTFSEGGTPQDRDLLEQGKDYGLRRLRLDPAFVQREEEDFEAAIGLVIDPAALLWTAHNWGAHLSFSPLQGILSVGKIMAMYERCLAIDEGYWGASAHSALGAVLTVTPPPFGGDVERGRRHLEKAIALDRDYLESHVVYAQYWGFAYDFLGNVDGVRDRELIERELKLVLEAPIGDWPFWNRVAKKEAQSLLGRLKADSP